MNVPNPLGDRGDDVSDVVSAILKISLVEVNQAILAWSFCSGSIRFCSAGNKTQGVNLADF
jgi:hypothetical protein